MQLSLLSRCPVPRRTGQWDRWDSMGQMGQAGQQEKQDRRSCLQDMKRRTNHEKAACTRLYASRPYHCRTWEHTNRALIFQSVPGCPKCPTVPAFRGRDSGTTVENQTSKKVMSNYSLQKYKGTSTRHTCPNCGDRRSFAYYVDESGTPLHPSVGRCNHESGCGYHYTPRQYFHDHPECRTAGDFSSGRQCMAQKPKQPLQQTAIGYIPPHYVEKSQSVHSNFCRFLSVLLDSYYGSKAKEVLERLMEDYRLGATRDGAVIFWQIDRENKVRTGKVMQYNPGDGHRVKDGHASAVNWIHSILKRQRVLAEEWQLSQCLFGEHLLSVYPDKVAVLVESEKSAVIGSALFPDYVWLAAGGKSQLREEKLRVLSGRTLLLFPDADAYAEWKERADGMTFCKVMVSDLIEKNATPEQKAAHIDIADWIIYQIRDSRINCTADHLVEAERILLRMTGKNPALQKLIDDLGLVLVSASLIGSGDGNPP